MSVIKADAHSTKSSTPNTMTMGNMAQQYNSSGVGTGNMASTLYTVITNGVATARTTHASPIPTRLLQFEIGLMLENISVIKQDAPSIKFQTFKIRFKLEKVSVINIKFEVFFDAIVVT